MFHLCPFKSSNLTVLQLHAWWESSPTFSLTCPALTWMSSAMFKSLTGGDSIPAERKFKDAFDFTPFARMLFSANQPPLSHDASDAFFQRWLVLPFTQVYRGTKQEVSRIELDARLSAPAELSGVLNKAVAALPEVLKNGVKVTASMRAA